MFMFPLKNIARKGLSHVLLHLGDVVFVDYELSDYRYEVYDLHYLFSSRSTLELIGIPWQMYCKHPYYHCCICCFII